MRKTHKTPINDPVEKIVADALHQCNVPFYRYHDSLDFELENGVKIECKAGFTERVVNQLAKHDQVILIQGYYAALSFAKLVTKGGI